MNNNFSRPSFIFLFFYHIKQGWKNIFYNLSYFKFHSLERNNISDINQIFNNVFFYNLISDTKRKVTDLPPYYFLKQFIESKGFKVKYIGGSCPFQIEATNKKGISLYFRSRGYTRLECYPSSETDFYYKYDVIFRPISYIDNYLDDKILEIFSEMYKELESKSKLLNGVM